MNAIRNASADAVDESVRLNSNAHAYTHQLESLDATFALLDGVRAQSFALQLRLRNSLPVRWSSNALVMQRSSSAEQHTGWNAKRHAGAGTDVLSQRRAYKDTHRGRREYAYPEGSSSARDCLPLDELDWNYQRYRRKIEWDVAKRIARIDRELTSLPPAQRFWNKKRAQEQHQQQLMRQKELSKTRAMNARVKVQDVTSEYGSPRKKPGEKAVVTIKKKTPEARHSLPRVSPHGKENLETRNAQTRYEKQTTVKRMSRPAERDPLRSSIDNSVEKRKPVDSHREKENQPPKSEQKTPAAESVQSKKCPLPDLQSSPIDMLNANERQSSTYNDQDLPPSEEARAAVVVTETKPEDKLAREIFLDLDEPTMDVHSNADQRGRANHRHVKPAATSGYQQQTSSVGRHVLSDFRNVPSMALYGPPAVTGDRRNRKLNSDVLRRLFSDLDSDRDGHLNRIETCMALHRLQIAVPAPRIASFFRRVYKLDRNDRGNSNRAAVLQPLNEVINYKQFAAFVTAANDRQGLQQQSRPELSYQRTRDHSETSTPAPPSRQRTVNSIPPMQFSASISAPPTRGNALYELVDTNEEEDQLEQSVLKSIPDYVISRLLADESDRGESSRKKAVNVARRSLEKLLPRDSIDEKMVQEIARELIREHLQSRILPAFVKDDEEDSSGLSRAAAYFEKLSTSLIDLGEETRDEGGEIEEDLDSWLNLLTEEQVAALVQEILKEKTPTLLQLDRVEKELEDTPFPVESVLLESPTSEGRPETQTKDDKETDTQDFLSTHLQLVAEKEVQAGEAELGPVKAELCEPDQKTQQSSLATKDDPTLRLHRLPPTRTNLAKGVLLASLDGQADETIAVRKRVLATSISTLQQLRAERKRYSRVPAKPEVQSMTKVRDSNDRRPSKLTQPQMVDRSIKVNSVDTSSDDSAHFTRQSVDEAFEMDRSVTSDAFPKLIKKKLFTADDLPHQDNSFTKPSRYSSSASLFSDLSSSGDSQRSLFSDFATVSTNKNLMASSSRHSQHKKKWVDANASMSSSYRSSLASEDLSEGEIERRASLDLSDGELVGKERKRVAMQKNAANKFFGERAASDDVDSNDELDDSKSSIESGELLPITKLRNTYRQQVLDLSFSSAESGELEDGLLG